MFFTCQCWACGETVSFIAPTILAGNYPCPVCDELGVHVPESDLFHRGGDHEIFDVPEVVRFDSELINRAILTKGVHRIGREGV